MDELVDVLCREAIKTRRPLIALALHVGGLRLHNQPAFVRAFNSADVGYADGIGAVALARAGGARRIGRAPTTDLGWKVLHRWALASSEPVRVALIGGPPGLAARAAQALVGGVGVQVVLAVDGYREDWDEQLELLRKARPHVLFVGMGMPREAHWVADHRDSLPPCLVMTCGGWFGFLAGEERRAPRIVQRAGLEWTWRLAQQPRRLVSRYAGGLFALVPLIARALCSRLYPTTGF